jgi:hypothetical protein
MLWLAALRQDHLDITLNSTPDIVTRVIDRPGAWMAPDARASLIEDVRTIARATLPEGDLTYGVLGGDIERLKASVITILYDRNTRAPIAFNALAWLPVNLRGRSADVLHLGLVMVDPSVRSRGMSWILYGFTCFVLFLRGGMRPLWVSNVTQVPAVFGMVAESFAMRPTHRFPVARIGYVHPRAHHVFHSGPRCVQRLADDRQATSGLNIRIAIDNTAVPAYGRRARHPDAISHPDGPRIAHGLGPRRRRGDAPNAFRFTHRLRHVPPHWRGTSATARSGPPEPPTVLIGSAITHAPRAGRLPRFVRFSRPGTFAAAAVRCTMKSVDAP